MVSNSNVMTMRCRQAARVYVYVYMRAGGCMCMCMCAGVWPSRVSSRPSCKCRALGERTMEFLRHCLRPIIMTTCTYFARRAWRLYRVPSDDCRGISFSYLFVLSRVAKHTTGAVKEEQWRRPLGSSRV